MMMKPVISWSFWDKTEIFILQGNLQVVMTECYRTMNKIVPFIDVKDRIF